MISFLYGQYRRSPFWIRNFIGHLTWPLRIAMLPFKTLHIGGYAMVLDFMDNASFKYFTDRDQYEYVEMTAFIGSIIRNPGVVVLDIGANYGAFSLAAAQLHKYNLISRIIAVEPDKRAYHAMLESLEKNKLEKIIQLYRLIVSDHDGKAQFFVNSRSSADNRSVKVETAPIAVRDQYDVSCATIDSLLMMNNVSLDSKFIVKIDIQGNEPRAFAGMYNALKQSRGFIVFFEHCPYLIESAGIEIAQFVNTLKKLDIDGIFEIYKESSIRSLDGLRALERSFQSLCLEKESNLQGACTSYILSKNMNLEGLNL